MLHAHWSMAAVTGAIATIAVAALANAQAPGQETAEQPGGLTAEELDFEPLDPADRPIAAADATDVKIAPVAEIGYFDEHGRYVVDLMQQDYTYIAVRVETADGRPVEDAEPVFSIEGTSQLLKPQDVSMPATSNQYGIVEFAVVGGEMGLDRIAVEYGEASTEILVNVISLRANAFPTLMEGEGFLSWDNLMQARVRYEDAKLFAELPAAVTERSGKTVKISGFMMPLETGVKQNWFLLTTHPPGCFFHVPGGPSGVIEVFAKESIGVSWDPIVLEGRFEALEESESAMYQLHDARLAN
ncbi:MAG: DUF3299 domain-containing protein [Pseudomonadota bacterium]